MMKSRLTGLLGFLCFVSFGQAQEVLTLKQLTDSVLENNYAIRLIRIDEEVAEINNTPGAAGYSPSVGLIGGVQGSLNNTRQEFYSGDVREATGAQNQSANAAVRLDWTLFNGFYIQNTREMLRQNVNLAQSNTILQLENELFSATSLYYEIIARRQFMATIDSSMRFGRMRFELAKKQLELGKGNRLEYVQSLLDLQADSAQWLQQQTLLNTLYIRIKSVMGANPDALFRTSDTFGLLNTLVLEDVRQNAMNQNNQIRQLKIQERLGQLDLKRTKSQRYPRLDLFGEYSFVSSQSAVGILKSNRSLGPSMGLSLSYNLFNGNEVNRQMEEARLELDRLNLQMDYLNYTLEMDIRIAYENYLLQRNLAEFELKNRDLAMENLRLAQIQLNAGSITPFQFRDVQVAALQAESRHAEALFSQKVAELELLRLSGGLLQFLQSA